MCVMRNAAGQQEKIQKENFPLAPNFILIFFGAMVEYFQMIDCVKTFKLSSIEDKGAHLRETIPLKVE